MRFDHRILLVAAPGLLLVVSLVGCVDTPPPSEHGFADAVAGAGIAEPIRFVGTPMPTDAADDDVALLTMDEAARRALRHDPGVQVALADVRAALAEARQVRLIPNPVISVAFRFPEGGHTPEVEAGLAADLVSLLARPRRVSAADNRLRAASASALSSVLDRLSEVQERYAVVQALDARAGVIEKRKGLVARLLELARARFEAGESGRLDVLSLEAERVELGVELEQAASERREQRMALARLVGQPSSRAEWRLDPWAPLPPVASAVDDESDLVRAALELRPEVQAARWNLAALGDDAALARFAALDGFDAGVEAERDGDWSVGPAASGPLPLFDWGQQRRAKADAQRLAARHRLTQARREVVEQVRRAAESLRASEAALQRVRGELVPLTEQRVLQAEAAYTNGVADVTTVLLVEQELQAARLKLIELQQKVSTDTFRLHRAVGGPGIAADADAAAFGNKPLATSPTSTSPEIP